MLNNNKNNINLPYIDIPKIKKEEQLSLQNSIPVFKKELLPVWDTNVFI